MSKIMNFVFGVGVALILFLLVILGIEAFYPSPDQPWETCDKQIELRFPIDKPINITPEEENQRQECYTQQEVLVNNHNYKVFIIATIIAAVFIISSYFLLAYINISAGVASAGIVLSFYAFIKGWEASGPKTRFLVSLFLAVIVVVFAYLVAKKIKK
ncbi:MAG: hypothetical protein ABIA37_01035 [Candidatus Woesearchaeota archaeon]